MSCNSFFSNKISYFKSKKHPQKEIYLKNLLIYYKMFDYYFPNKVNFFCHSHDDKATFNLFSRSNDLYSILIYFCSKCYIFYEFHYTHFTKAFKSNFDIISLNGYKYMKFNYTIIKSDNYNNPVKIQKYIHFITNPTSYQINDIILKLKKNVI